MPISYSCPHCGKQFSVAEQYAGQTGPCAACGKPITIPMASGSPRPRWRRGVGVGADVTVVIALAVLHVALRGRAVALALARGAGGPRGRAADAVDEQPEADQPGLA